MRSNICEAKGAHFISTSYAIRNLTILDLS